MSSNVHKGLRMYINCLKMYFKNSLIMHEENTKKNNNIHSDDLKIENGKNSVLFYIFRKGKIVFVKNNS